MPKHNTTPIQLPAEQPDCCALCPLVGIIPKANRPKGTKETHCCLGTMEALSGRGIKEKRHFIGFELNKQYFDKACQRIDAEQRQLTLF